MTYLTRIKALKNKFSNLHIDGLLVTNYANILYLCGFSAGDSSCLITPKKNYLITDTRFIQEAQNNPARFKVNFYYPQNTFPKKVHLSSYLKLIKNLLKKQKIRRLGFEANNLSYKHYLNLKHNFSDIKLVPTADLIEEQRMIKSFEELTLIKKAISFAKKCFKYAEELLRPELTERNFALEVEYFIKKNGFTPSFDIIAATGKNSSRPHSGLTNKKIGKKNGLVLDLGICYKNYNCDLTRTLFLSKITPKFKDVYKLVKIAQQIAIENIKPGIALSKIDAIVRKFFRSHRMSEYFPHSLGHGVGLEVHERPILSERSKDKALEGMVFTIEPGIYIPDWAGIRIEDMVYITKKGVAILT